MVKDYATKECQASITEKIETKVKETKRLDRRKHMMKEHANSFSRGKCEQNGCRRELGYQ